MRRGLIPSWWKKTAKEVPSTFNTRRCEVASKPMFRCAPPAGRQKRIDGLKRDVALRQFARHQRSRPV